MNIHTYTAAHQPTQEGIHMNEIAVMQRGQLVDAQPITEALYIRFINYLDAKPKTVETYTRALRQLSGYLSSHGIGRPQREDILGFREDLKETGHKPTTIQNYITAARLFFQWTAQEGIYPNVAEHIKGATISKDHKKDYLTSKQVKKVLAGVDRTSIQGKRDYAMLLLMITGGLRTIEVSRAEIQDIRAVGDDTALFIQGKGRDEKTDYIKIQPKVEDAIRDYLKERGSLEPQQPLFCSTSHNSTGAALTTRSVSGIVKQRMREAGFDSTRLTAHSLRHTAVTLSLLGGEDLQKVQQFARHSNLATTMIYAHNLDRAKNKCEATIAAAIL